MAGMDRGALWEHEQFVFDRIENEVVAREAAAGGTRAAVEECVAAEEQPVGGKMKTAAAG